MPMVPADLREQLERTLKANGRGDYSDAEIREWMSGTLRRRAASPPIVPERLLAEN